MGVPKFWRARNNGEEKESQHSTPLQGQPPPRTRLPPQHWEINDVRCIQGSRKIINVRGILVLLVLSDKILHVGLGFREL